MLLAISTSSPGQRARCRISRCEQNLDRGGQHSGAGRRRSRVEQDTADRVGRGIDPALRKTKQRQSRIGLPSALIRPRVRGFSFR